MRASTMIADLVAKHKQFGRDLEHEPHLSVKPHLSKTSYHVETLQLICFSSQLTGF